MKPNWIITLFIASSATLLSACETAPRMTLEEDFGNAVRTNVAMQVINPDAGKTEPVATTQDGKKVEKGMERYYEATGKAETDRLVEDLGSGD